MAFCQCTPAFYYPQEAALFGLGTFSQAGSQAGSQGRTTAGLVREDLVLPLEQSTAELLSDWDTALEYLAELARTTTAGWLPVAELRAEPPVWPGQILQSGANYRKHVVDLIVSETDQYRGRTPDQVRADAEAMMDVRAASGEPYLFAGLPSALCGAADDIVLPLQGTQHDWELELALVIGRPARRVEREDALDHVAGYLIVNDITTRDLVYRRDLARIGTDWLRSKNSPTFLPAGPYLVPARFAKDPMDLWITLRHNGVTRQHENTSDMIFDIPTLISYASSLVPLSPGDMLLTGSPAGNGAHWGTFLRPGDVIEAEITGLGTQRNLCVSERTAFSDGTPFSDGTS
jgi:2-keto-4-pentenoate hydratase/2-oxohepta-3-ene-1,7-dioic acid hydratase in catechol pathway